jgi:hypothetical protein
MDKKINMLAITLIIAQFQLWAQKVQEFRTDERFVKNGITETYKFFDSTFSFSVNLKGFSSARTEAKGVYHQINDSTYILNSQVGARQVNELNKVTSVINGSSKNTYDVTTKVAETLGKTAFVFVQNIGNFLPNRSLVIYSQNLVYKIDMIQDSIMFNSDKVDSFYIIDNNYGIASEDYLGQGKNLNYYIKCNTTARIFHNEILSIKKGLLFSPSSYISRYCGFAILKKVN